MSTVLGDLPDLDRDAGSGIVARRAVIRWGWRLFRREWRQQLLVLGLLTVAVAATTWGAGVVTNVQLGNPNWAAYGTAQAKAKLPGSHPSLAADIARAQPEGLDERLHTCLGLRIIAGDEDVGPTLLQDMSEDGVERLHHVGAGRGRLGGFLRDRGLLAVG